MTLEIPTNTTGSRCRETTCNSTSRHHRSRINNSSSLAPMDDLEKGIKETRRMCQEGLGRHLSLRNKTFWKNIKELDFRTKKYNINTSRYMWHLTSPFYFQLNVILLCQKMEVDPDFVPPNSNKKSADAEKQRTSGTSPYMKLKSF